MRFVLYNIRYCAGTGPDFHWPMPFTGYLRRSDDNLRQISAFLASLQPDIIGLIEVDNGSYRSQKKNQAEEIARELNATHVSKTKYGQPFFSQHMPVLREQGNAFVTRLDIAKNDFHWFRNGIKRLVIELELDDYVVFLVHLSLRFRHRQHQLTELYKLFAETKKPKIVAGDFNVFWGDRELELFLAASKLISANKNNQPTFPSWAPKRQLDFVLHSPEIEMTRFAVPGVQFSDHMPLVCDFEVNRRA